MCVCVLHQSSDFQTFSAKVICRGGHVSSWRTVVDVSDTDSVSDGDDGAKAGC